MMKEYLQLFERLPFPCLLLKPVDGQFLVKDANRSYCDLSGKGKEDLLGQVYPQCPSATKNTSSKNFLERKACLQKAFNTGMQSTLECLREDLHSPATGIEERYWQVENIPMKDEEGNLVCLLNIAVDKTAEILEKNNKKEIELRLKQSLEKQQHLIEENPDGLYAVDNEGRFVSLNDGLVKLADLPEEELLGMDFLPFCTPHHKEKTVYFFQRALEGERQSFEADFISAKGKEMVLSISLMPMRINGKIKGAYGIAKDLTRLRKTEEALLKSQRKYKALVQEGSDLTAILDSDGNYTFVSENATAILGIQPEEYLGKNALDFVHPEDRERVKTEFLKLNTDKKVKVQPFRFRDNLGNWRWKETMITDLRDDPSVEGIVINSRDITERIESAAEFRLLYERYKLAAAATEDLIYDWDLKTDKVVRFSKGNSKLFGHTSTEMDRRGFWKEHIHPEEIPGLKKKLKETLKDPQQHQIKTQYRFRRADGTYAHVIDRGQIIRDENGEPLRLIGATSDISGVILSKNALKVANKRFSYAMKATKEMIWDWDISNGRIKRSSSFKKLFGYNNPKLPTADNFWFDKIADKDREAVVGSLQKALEDPGVRKWRHEYSFITKNGEKAYVIDRGFILRDKNGKPERMVGSVLDVTESRRLLKEVKTQNQVLKDVAWEQAHIVRAPLARLKGLLHVLEMEYFEEWSREEVMALINDSADELDEIIKNIIRKTEAIGKDERPF